MSPTEAMGMKSAFFPADEVKNWGSIIENKDYQPSDKGTIVYPNGGEIWVFHLQRLERGKVFLPKTSIGPNGFMAQFTDTQGNKVAFHSMK
jgi:predicted enzyme related to lactoylglutathione lyase